MGRARPFQQREGAGRVFVALGWARDASYPPRMRGRFLTSPHARALLALGAMLVLGCVFHQEGAFFRWSTHRDMLREVAVEGILACGMTLVILSGGIDLAVSSLLALSAVGFARLTIPLGWGAGPAIAVVL